MTKSSIDPGRTGRPDRAALLPGIRERALRGWRVGGQWHQVVQALHIAGRIDGDAGTYARFERETLQHASLWWVSGEMCALLEVAMQQLPHDVTLDTALLDTSGFCMFAHPMRLTDASTAAQDLIVDAVAWGPIHIIDALGHGGPGIGISSYTWHDATGAAPLGRSEWLTGHELYMFTPGQLQRGTAYCASAAEDRRLLAALTLLARQAHVAETSTVQPDRAALRRAARAGRNDAVRVVRLHPRHTGGHGGSGSASVRTIVRGHWRSQPCGPGRSARRMVWIAQHVRGPEDAPLVVRPTVRVI